MDSKAFDEFGKLLIERVRDVDILLFDRFLDAEKLIPRFKKYEPILKSLTAEQRAMFREMGSYWIDSTIHNLLFLFESIDWVKIRLEMDENIIEDIRQATTGDLQGYIFIWAEKYSKERLSDTEILDDRPDFL